MKILVTTPLYPPEVGGPATYSKMLEDNLPDRGFELEVLKYSDFNKYPKGVSHFIYFLNVLKKARKFDFVYTLDPFSVGLPTMLACKILNKKYVLRVPGDFAWEQLSASSKKLISLDDFDYREHDLKTRLRGFVQKRVALGAKIIITPSNYLKKVVVGWGIDESNVRVLNNIFEPKGFKIEADNKHSLAKINIVTAGRLVKWKGFSALIEAFAKIKEDFSDIKLFIAGDGPEKKVIENKIKELCLEDIIELVGFLDKYDLYNLLKKSDVFVLNTFYEGFSHQLLEVMNLEIPIISTHSGGNPEVIEDGKEGLLVDYDDIDQIKKSIIKILSDKDFSNFIVKNAKEKTKVFSKEKILIQLENILKKEIV